MVDIMLRDRQQEWLYTSIVMRVGYIVASPLFPLTLGLEIVAIASGLSTGGLDSKEHPIAGVVGSVPNIAVNRFVRNRNYSQVGSVAVLLSVRGTFVETSGRFPCVGVGQEIEVGIS